VKAAKGPAVLGVWEPALGNTLSFHYACSRRRDSSLHYGQIGQGSHSRPGCLAASTRRLCIPLHMQSHVTCKCLMRSESCWAAGAETTAGSKGREGGECPVAPAGQTARQPAGNTGERCCLLFCNREGLFLLFYGPLLTHFVDSPLGMKQKHHYCGQTPCTGSEITSSAHRWEA